jgi:very-short-patch-repair endonuclease
LRFDGFDEDALHVSACGKARRYNGMRVSEVSDDLLRHVITVDRMVVTNTRRTIFDVMASRDERGEALLDQAIRRRSNIIDQMWLMLDEAWTFRRCGVAIVRSALEGRTPGRGPSQVDLADLLLRLLRRHRLPLPVAEHPIALPSQRIQVDLAYPMLKLAIECDGYATHMDRRSFENDRARDAELMALGWKVRRFTWAQITFRSEWVIEQVRRALAS